MAPSRSDLFWSCSYTQIADSYVYIIASANETWLLMKWFQGKEKIEDEPRYIYFCQNKNDRVI
jgi:hypothetical protein